MTLLGLSLNSWLALWGAGLSTVLGLVKLYETFWKNRIRLATTYSFTNGNEEPDTVTVVNLSDMPVQIANWSLAWEPDFLHKDIGTKDQTPHEGGSRFTLTPKGEHTLYFDGPDSLKWGSSVSENRKLYLRLKIFGRRGKMTLRVA